MTKIVKTHNDLNGVKFSVAEFSVIALVVTPFAIYYVVHAQVVLALVTSGIETNCLTVVAFGARAWQSHRTGIGLRRLFDGETRARLQQAHPHLGRETIVLTLSVLAPFVLLCLIIYERFMPLDGDR